MTLYASLCLLALVGLPLWFGLAALVDLLRDDHRWPTVRFLALLIVYLLCEVAWTLMTLALWLSRPAWGRRERTRLTGHRARYLSANFRVQCWWATTLIGRAVRIFGIRIEIDASRPPPVGTTRSPPRAAREQGLSRSRSRATRRAQHRWRHARLLQSALVRPALTAATGEAPETRTLTCWPVRCRAGGWNDTGSFANFTTLRSAGSNGNVP